MSKKKKTGSKHGEGQSQTQTQNCDNKGESNCK